MYIYALYIKNATNAILETINYFCSTPKIKQCNSNETLSKAITWHVMPLLKLRCIFLVILINNNYDPEHDGSGSNKFSRMECILKGLNFLFAYVSLYFNNNWIFRRRKGFWYMLFIFFNSFIDIKWKTLLSFCIVKQIYFNDIIIYKVSKGKKKLFARKSFFLCY